jgi:hypothetical protein
MKHIKHWMFLLLFFPIIAFADTAPEHLDPVTSVIFWVTLIFFFGVIGRYLAIRLHQPGVLGELLMGVLVGNVCYFFGMQLAIILREGPAVFSIMRDLLSGLPLAEAVDTTIRNPHYATQVMNALSSTQGIDLIKVAYVVDIFSRYGVIFLLFMVGLESSVTELRRTGRESFQVAVIGVVAPILLGLLVSFLLMPNSPFNVHLFVAATLSATSVGIKGNEKIKYPRGEDDSRGGNDRRYSGIGDLGYSQQLGHWRGSAHGNGRPDYRTSLGIFCLRLINWPMGFASGS